jgi:putative tryptophan/tyrosine transport system substrate-binding protein
VLRRRQFLYAIVATLTLPIAADAQQKVRQIGVLLPFDDERDPQVIQLWPAFTQRMQELGWSEGRNVHYDLRFATQDADRIRKAAVDLVTSAPDLIYVWANPALASLKQATRTCRSRKSYPHGLVRMRRISA